MMRTRQIVASGPPGTFSTRAAPILPNQLIGSPVAASSLTIVSPGKVKCVRDEFWNRTALKPVDAFGR